MQPPLSQRVSACLGLLTAAALLCPVAGARSAPHGQETPRYVTDRPNAIDLPLPGEEDAFTFAIFGDRTGGPDRGVSILADAVRDVNLLEPDLVMTVGDLIQGYNTTPSWMRQMTEFKDIMSRLLCPWFPVAGNHDIYWRGEPAAPEGEHEASYEMHFGPLWYAFSHKGSFFIILYTDEGHPVTGEKNFGKPSCQIMSPEQFAWLDEMLTKAKDADHVFLFMHHPRWLSQYGSDWDRVHARLLEAGNVTAAFAGHIHRMRSDPRDGIEYISLATTGGHQRGTVPSAGWLHHYHIVTVRKGQVALTAYPVGAAMDVREITNELQRETERLVGGIATIESPAVTIREDGSASATTIARITNPTSRPIEVALSLGSDDSRWIFGPDHQHRVLDPGAAMDFEFRVGRLAPSADAGIREAILAVDVDYLADGFRYSIPTNEVWLPVDLEALSAPEVPETDRALTVGRGGHLRVPSDGLDVPDGPITVECRFRAKSFGSRVGLLAKTEMSEYGIFVSNGVPTWSIFLDDRYLEVEPEGVGLAPGRWYHVAGVYDGEEARLYLDGRQIGSATRRGVRKTNELPFLIGADVRGDGSATSGFHGEIDSVRVSTIARYDGPSFEPPARHTPDESTALHFEMDGRYGRWVPGTQSRLPVGTLQGAAALESR